MDTISITNQKGGVGKTVTTAGIGAALAELGYRVLLVDLDPQGHLTTGATGVPSAPDRHVTLSQALLGADVDLRQLITEWRPGLDVVPTHNDSFRVEQGLVMMTKREHQLLRVLRAVDDDYDFCLIDAPPSLGLLTDNALVAAGKVIIPLEALDSSIDALSLLLGQINSMRDPELGHGLQIDVIGLVVGRYDRRQGDVVTSSLEALREVPVPILGIVHDRAVIRRAWRMHEPITTNAPRSDSAAVFRTIARTLAAAS